MNKYKLSTHDVYSISIYVYHATRLFKYDNNIFSIEPKSDVIYMFKHDVWVRVAKDEQLLPTYIIDACVVWSLSDFSDSMPISEFLYKTLDNEE